MENQGTGELEKVKIRGLVRASGWIFLIWGVVITLKGLLDAFWLEPEANYYSLKRWEFITLDQWIRYATFEVVYGVVCIIISGLLFEYSKRVADYISRPRIEDEDIF